MKPREKRIHELYAEVESLSLNGAYTPIQNILMGILGVLLDLDKQSDFQADNIRVIGRGRV